MRSCFIFILAFFICYNFAYSQYTVKGDFSRLAGHPVRLVGFDGFDIYTIDSTIVSREGIFQLDYAANDMGMGYLTSSDNKAYFVVLEDQSVRLKGADFGTPASVLTLSGEENKTFTNYAVEHSSREQALNAWDYLSKMYRNDSLFKNQKYTAKSIEKEISRIKQEDIDFLNGLDPESYVGWFLPKRKLIASVANVAQYKTNEIPATIDAFRAIDYTDKRWYKSGLLKDAIESHFWLLENMGKPLDVVCSEMKVSIDVMLANLSANETQFNLVTKYIFNLLERQSLQQVSEYLAVKILTQNSCTLNDEFTNQLEAYRAMKKGKTAPNILFNGDLLKKGKNVTDISQLSEVNAPYKVVVFGASWCPKCAEELGQLLPLYQKWRSKGVEVVFISLDTEESSFKNFTAVFPFISSCDYRKWDSQAVVDYHVFASPTMLLLDQNHTILLRPNSVKQMDAWIDFKFDRANDDL